MTRIVHILEHALMNFKKKKKSRLENSVPQVLDGMLEGAARLKTVHRVITILMTL